MSTQRTVAQRLDTFLNRVSKVRNSSIASGPAPSLMVKLAVPGPGGAENVEGPEPDKFKSLMVDFRPFTLANEDVNFLAITELLEQRLTDPGLKADNDQNRSAWKSMLDGKFKLAQGSKEYDANQLFKLVTN